MKQGEISAGMIAALVFTIVLILVVAYILFQGVINASIS